jgi:hypothetical protein
MYQCATYKFDVDNGTVHWYHCVMEKHRPLANVPQSVSAAAPQIDRYGNPIAVITIGRAAVPQSRALHTPHGSPGHKCYLVYPWQREFWTAQLHTGKHDCPDGGCE